MSRKALGGVSSMPIIWKSRVGSCGHSHITPTPLPPESDVFGQVGLGPARRQSGAGRNIPQRQTNDTKDTEFHENRKSSNSRIAQNDQHPYFVGVLIPIRSRLRSGALMLSSGTIGDSHEPPALSASAPQFKNQSKTEEEGFQRERGGAGHEIYLCFQRETAL